MQATTKITDLERRAEIGRVRRAKTRAKILRAAFNVFGQESGVFTTIDIICREAGVSRPTFYNHFESLEDVHSALSNDITHDFLEFIIATNQKMSNPAKKLAFGTLSFLEHARTDPRWGWGILNLSATGPLFGIEVNKSVENDLLEGMESNLFNLNSVDIGRDIVAGTCHAVLLTQLTKETTADYPRRAVCRILVALGLQPDQAKVIVYDIHERIMSS